MFFIMVFMCNFIYVLFNYSFSNEQNLNQLKSVCKWYETLMSWQNT